MIRRVQEPAPTRLPTPTNTRSAAAATSPRPSFDLAAQLSSPDSALSVAIGNAEGTRTVSGGRTAAFAGHIDPGNGAQNAGTFSYQVKQGGAGSPAEADQVQLARFRAVQPQYEAAARNAGLDPKDPLLAAAFFDSWNQSPAMATEKNGFLDQLPRLAREGVTLENVTNARVRSWYEPNGRLNAPGLGNTEASVRADQSRRMNAIADVLKTRGLLDGSAATSDFSSTPAASNEFAGADLIRKGATGPEVSRLQELLNARGASPALSVDGDFGAKTEEAVRAFQRSQTLAEDGVVGPDTREALASRATNGNLNDTGLHPSTLDTAGYRPTFEIRPGSTGPKVKELKQAMKDAGFYPGVVNDQMGPDGLAALKKAKEALKLGGAPDIAGDFTLAKIQKAAAKKPEGVVTAGNFTVDSNNPSLKALATGALRGDAVGMCVRATLNNMEALGVRQPAATGMDAGNNPRGGMVQMVRDFGWKSLPLAGAREQTIESPYGTIKANVIPAADYERLARDGKIPSGAIVFQTRHGSWNSTSDRSSGFDMGIARNGGRTLFNYADMGGPMVYGAATQSVVVLVPGNALSAR
ncbi:MAG: peptidoglycan-binding protein [Myxococcales bacterium]|nr:peptidoglycan-binding protein [Myxococcales bacterium]MDP3503144.1 peptidoglycan-binding protein [Myxococcales bacterium]